jgi:type VI secretion system secreted protein VgrG
MNVIDKALGQLSALFQPRLLRLSYPDDDAPAATLHPNRFKGVERISRGFEYTVELISEDADISLEEMHGKLLCISLVQRTGGLRPFTGYVWRFAFVKTDGGFAHYEATLVPWFEFLRLRQNNRVFSNQNLDQQVRTVFADHAEVAAWDWRVTADDPEFTMAVQFAETDHNYISRRLEHAGFSYSYEHTAEGHVLVIGDDTAAAKPIDGATPDVRFHSEGGSDDEDAIGHWRPGRVSASAEVSVSGFDFKNPTPYHNSCPTVNPQGHIPKLEVHRYEGHYGFKGASGADTLARRRMEAIEARGKAFHAEGNCDRLMVGRWFALSDHFGYSGDDAQFLVLEIEHEATNNYLQGDDTPAEYKNRLICQSKAVPWQAGPEYNSINTRILATQTATVVGPGEDGSLHVDKFGRVRVQFHWDRAGTQSAWVRVSSQWAGGEKGMTNLPRVGSEAVIQFLDGNPDHPLITGCVSNQSNMPPWQLPEQKALSGIRSRELTASGGNQAGGRSNHVLLDDTPGQMQVQVKSDHLASQLSLGHITRIEDNSGR